MYTFQFDKGQTTPKVKQIVHSVIMTIESGDLKKNERLPSINEFNERFSVGRDTVEKAYNLLKKAGYIQSVKGRGYFISGKPDKRLKILLMFNKLSSYKKIIYDSFVQTLGKRGKVDLFVHQYNPALLREGLADNISNYHYVVLMPHFFHTVKAKEYLEVLKTIPSDKLMLLDKDLPRLKNVEMALFQDFKMDIYEALSGQKDILEKYKGITLVFPRHSHHPLEIIDGVQLFCGENGKRFEVCATVNEAVLSPGQAYIILTEADLAGLIKAVRKTDHQIGKDIGIISFNETVFKELLDITVITTDFEQMGVKAAEMLLNGTRVKLRNPFLFIKRGSV